MDTPAGPPVPIQPLEQTRPDSPPVSAEVLVEGIIDDRVARHTTVCACIAIPLLVTGALGGMTAIGIPSGRGVPVFGWPAAIAFTASSLLCLWLSGRVRPLRLIPVAAFGLTYPLWMAWVAMFTLPALGHMGLPHSILSGVVIAVAARSLGLGAACAAVIFPTWAFTWLSGMAADELFPARIGGKGDLTIMDFGVMEFGPFWWNAGVSIILAAWAIVQRRRLAAELASAAGACRACGYDLAGLPGDVCPECGAAGSPG